MNTQGNTSTDSLDKVPLTQYCEDDGNSVEQEEDKLPPYSPSPAVPATVTVQPLMNQNGSKVGGYAVVEDPPMDTIKLAIFTMICCCWPCGLVGLLNAIKAMQAHYHGDSKAAELANKRAKRWICRSIIAGVITIVALSVNGIVRGLVSGLTAGHDVDGSGADGMDDILINATAAATVAY